jgi:hypothetical protein
MAFALAKVIEFTSILAKIGQVKGLLEIMQRVDLDGVVARKITRQSYGGLKLLGASSRNGQGRLSTWPQLLGGRQKIY